MTPKQRKNNVYSLVNRYTRTEPKTGHFVVQESARVQTLHRSDTYVVVISCFHSTTKYAPYLRWSRKEKLNCLVQMNICAFRLTIIEHDPVDFIFTWPFLL